MAYAVAELTSDEEILSLLLHYPEWTVYAISDVYPPYRRNATFLGARRDGRLESVLLLYSLPTFTSLLPFGDAPGVEEILDAVDDLPETPFIIVREEHLPVVQRSYVLADPARMSRMAVEAQALRPSGPIDRPIMRLDRSHFEALDELYQSLEGRFFDVSMLANGPYFGIFDAGDLIAAAGMHTLSAKHGLGTIGNVATRPAYRGRGYATALTHAVASALVDMGAGLLALNVRQDNVPAVRAYTKLGFVDYVHFFEGNAVLRGH